MPTTLTTKAVEKSTYIISCAFKDAAGDAVVPDSITWTLTDENGNVVNDREDVAPTPAESIDIVLSGDDLAVLANTSDLRIVTIEWVYDSTEGNNLPGKDEARFRIVDLKNVS
jgi:hypothetical protein